MHWDDLGFGRYYKLICLKHVGMEVDIEYVNSAAERGAP